MTDAQLLALAKDAGFEAAIIPTNEIVIEPSFRPFCEENRCGKYNANYSCPPDCGTVEETTRRLRQYPRALVLENIFEIGSYENKAKISEVRRQHNAAVLRLTDALRGAGLEGFCLGYGGCPLCDPCKRVSGEPCAFPERRISCLSAYCIHVAKLAERCALPFAWEQERLYLFGLFAFAAKG